MYNFYVAMENMFFKSRDDIKTFVLIVESGTDKS